MTSYCEAPTLPHLDYPSHDIARSLGQLLPMPVTGSEYKSETPEQVLATGKLSHLRQTIQTVAFSRSTQRKGERCSFFALLMTIKYGFSSIVHFMLVAVSSHSSELSLEFSMNASSPHSSTQI